MEFTSALREEYARLFDACTVREASRSVIEDIVVRIVANRARYEAVSTRTGVPWFVVAVIHAKEASLRFTRHLHNGDPLTARTVHVPAGRPPGEPPFTWEDSAEDALAYDGFTAWRDWSIAGTLYKLEGYNGWGYRAHHPDVLTPYLWSGSNHYTRGLYVEDGRFDPDAVSRDPGAAVVLRRLRERGDIAWGDVAVTLDPGHGGDHDTGASSAQGAYGGGVREQDVTLAVARAAAARLGDVAALTRAGDHNVDLAARASTARRNDSRAFVSVHAGGASPGRDAVWVHERAGDGSRRMAGHVARALHRATSRPVELRGGALALLRPEALPPDAAACLVELGALDDPRDAARLGDPRFLRAVGEALAQGIGRHLGDGARYGTPAALFTRYARRAVARPRPLDATDDDALRSFGDAAVAAAQALWRDGVKESKPQSTDQIARDSGWGNNLQKGDGTVWDWCGMFVATCLFRAGLGRALRKGFYHTLNVEGFFRYQWQDRVPRWVWVASESTWRDVREEHAARAALRRWIDRATLRATAPTVLDIAPGDVVLIDHNPDTAADHIALVERYDPSTGELVTLEGNAGGTVAVRIEDDGTVVEGAARGDAVARNVRDLGVEAVRRKVYGVGRASLCDFDERPYSSARAKPTAPP